MNQGAENPNSVAARHCSTPSSNRVYASSEARSVAPERRCRAKTKNKNVLARIALSVAPCHPTRTAFLPVLRTAVFVPASRPGVKDKNSRLRRTGVKKMLVTSKARIRSVRQVVWSGVELLAHDIETGHPEVLSECLKAMARFHTYSFGNVLLISTQRPTATQVAGWRGWNELGRRIKQGEKGILIFAPILSEPKQPTKTDADNTSEPAEPQQELLGFRQVRVWDISQTEGEPVPANDLFSGLELPEVLSKLTEFAASQEFQIEYSDKIEPARGTSYRGLIRLMPDMEAEETVSVLLRELALQMLYNTERRSFVTRDVLLREAKAVAFVVCNALALDTEPAENIQLYRSNLHLLAESLEVVQRTSAVILGALSPKDAHDGKAVQ